MAVAAIQRSPSWTLLPRAWPACWQRRQLGAGRDHVVVGLDDRDLGDATFRPSASQPAPPGSQGAETQLHDGLEGEQDGLRAEELRAGWGDRRAAS
jgi:hypothetical protein